MKKITLLTIMTISFLSAGAQISSLNEDFDVACATALFPSSDGWMVINPVPGTNPPGAWNCTSTNGRPNTLGSPTPGVQCTGTYSSAYHLDTSFFVTPLLNVSSYTGHVYLRFDTKKDNIVLGGKLSVMTHDSALSSPYYDLGIGGLVTPPFGDADSLNWVTHQADITNYKDSGSFYLAFRYTSATTYGTAWYLDNIKLTTIPLSVGRISKDILPLTVTGNSTYSQITLSYTIGTAGKYHIAIYDMVGRRVYDEQVVANSGTASYVIKGLDLHPGMYCIKIGNENTYGTTKLMIQ